MKKQILLILAFIALCMTGCESAGGGGKGASQGTALGDRVMMQGHISTSATTTKTRIK
jgi:predicted small secreted protein